MFRYSILFSTSKLHSFMRRHTVLYVFVSQFLLGFLLVAGVSAFALAGGSLLWCVMRLGGLILIQS